MGGTIGAESELGRGSSFWIELPITAMPEPLPATPASDEPLPRSRPGGPERTVLYIEDNPSSVKLAERILARRPEALLLVAMAGDAGVELAREHRPALVILDLNLPGLSGEEVFRRIRSDPRTAETAVVIVSADATPGQIDRLREAGADDYLTKPFEIDQFLVVVDRFDGRDEA